MDLTNAGWRKSSYSGSNGGNCVEIASLPDAVGIRDSKDKTGPVLTVTPEAFASFTEAIRAGEFDGI